MKRTKIKDRKLPDYTKGEEIINMVSHIVGGGIGVTATVLCVVFAAIHKNVYGIISGAVFGTMMVVLYTMSSIYHGLRPNTAKKSFTGCISLLDLSFDSRDIHTFLSLHPSHI